MGPGQIAQVGAQLQLNHLCGVVTPVVSASPPTWIPGLWWIDSGNGYVTKEWNGSAWIVSTGNRYLALLSGDPTAAVQVSDLQEITTPGYQRSLVTIATATAAIPSISANTALVSWGPVTNDMLVPAQWAAMVTSASGTSGQLLYKWTIPAQQVSASEYIQVANDQMQLISD